MKLRLQITTPAGPAFAFEHPGPIIRIGRDPECELALEGDVSQSVSWKHATIELRSDGAFLTDLQSTNGTIVNDQRITRPVALKRWDEIRLGFTGPRLKVVEVDWEASAKNQERPPAAAPVSTRPPTSSTTQTMLALVQRTQRNLMIGIGVLVAAVLVLVLVLVLRSGPTRTPDQNLANANDKTAEPNLPTEPVKNTLAEGLKKNGEAPEKPAESLPKREPEPTKPKENRGAPPAGIVRRELGRFIRLDKEPPSVLLQRQGEGQPWAVLQPDKLPNDRVYSSHYLVSLPGYRSRVYLDSGVHVLLWGNVPEFSTFPPLLESAVMLNAPEAGIDLDITLDRGRVHLANYKQPAAPAQIRLRFYQEIWDLTLPDQTTEVVVELWRMYPPEIPFSKDGSGKGPLAGLGIFTKGQATLKTRQQTYTLPNDSQFSWSNWSPTPTGPAPPTQPLDWWTNKLSPQKPEIADIMLALQDFQQALNKPNAVVLDTVLTQLRESPDPANRKYGVLCLAALDDLPHLMDALEDRQRPEVRGSAVYALQRWIARSIDHDQEVYHTLYEKKGYSREKAEIIMQLLHGFSRAELANPATYEKLIGYLDHENLVIRGLAYWQLSLLAPEGARTIAYDPTADADKRKGAVEQWRKLIPPGTVPHLPGAKPG